MFQPLMSLKKMRDPNRMKMKITDNPENRIKILH